MSEKLEIQADYDSVRRQLECIGQEEPVISSRLLRETAKINQIRDFYLKDIERLLADQAIFAQIQNLQKTFPSVTAVELIAIAMYMEERYIEEGIELLEAKQEKEYRPKGIISTAPSNSTVPPNSTTPSLWEKTDRIAIMLAGGAALGGAIGQIPGVVVGLLVAATCGWHINFVKSKSA